MTKLAKVELAMNSIIQNPENLTQSILDTTSFNLESRVHRDDPIVQLLFKLSRDTIHNARMKKLKELFEK